MEKIFIENTEDTPRVTLNTEDGVYELFGRSLPEDAAEFYEPILKWLDVFNRQGPHEMKFIVKLEYFNTSSSKLLLDILIKFEEMRGTGKNITVKWFYYDDDADMLAAGEEFAELVEVPFEYFTYEN